MRPSLNLSPLETQVGRHKLMASLGHTQQVPVSKQRVHAVLCEMHGVTPPFLFLGFRNLIEKVLNSLVNSVQILIQSSWLDFSTLLTLNILITESRTEIPKLWFNSVLFLHPRVMFSKKVGSLMSPNENTPWASLDKKMDPKKGPHVWRNVKNLNSAPQRSPTETFTLETYYLGSWYFFL